MRRSIYCAFLIAVLCLAQAPAVRDLHCENEVNPRGIRTQHPTLTWTWGAPTTPRAYQILVASSEEKLKADEADLWNSGQVRTDQKTAQYEGKPLSSFQRCYWKVRVWNDYDTPGYYTETASWQMALLPSTEPETK